jgi:NADH-quinone oxidoreductase subunit M
VRGAEKKMLQDLNARELATMLTLMALLVLFGLYPQPVLDLSKAPMHAVQAIYQAAQATLAQGTAGGAP